MGKENVKSGEKNALFLVALDALKQVKQALHDLGKEETAEAVEIGHIEESIEKVKSYILTSLDESEYQEMIERLDDVTKLMHSLMERYGSDTIDNSKVRRLLPNWTEFVEEYPEFSGVANAMIEFILNKRQEITLSHIDPQKLREATEIFEAKQRTVFPQIEEEQRRINAQLEFVKELELILEAKFTGKLTGNIQEMRQRIEKSFSRRFSDPD